MAKYAAGQLTTFGGFERVQYDNASGVLSNTNTVGGYVLNQSAGPFGLNYQAYATERVVDLRWLGARYAFTGKLTGSLAWYRLQQEGYVAGAATPSGWSD